MTDRTITALTQPQAQQSSIPFQLVSHFRGHSFLKISFKLGIKRICLASDSDMPLIGIEHGK
jgi:hypothetical protein